MKLSEIVITGRKARPRRLLVYGVAGVGKTTFAASCPKPLVVDLEDGSGDIDCARVSASHITTIDDLMQICETLASGDTEFKTLVLDSLDQIEALVHDRICRQENVESIDAIGYGKGFAFAACLWRDLLELLEDVQEAGIMIVFIGHAEITRFDDPATESYSRYVPRLDKRASALVVDWVDECLFATYRVHTTKQNEQFGKDQYRGISTGDRIFKTEERPSQVAKNRLGMPAEIALSWDAYREFAYPKKKKEEVSNESVG